MSDNTSVIYFPPNQNAKAGYLGGGYITSGFLKTRFSVRESVKNASGIWVVLPSKQNQAGEWVNEVEFPNKEASERVEKLVLEQMSKNGVTVKVSNASFDSSPRPVQNPQPSESSARTVSRQPVNAGIPVKPPF